MLALESLVDEFNKVLNPPLYAQYTDVIDMYASASIHEKRVPWSDSAVADLQPRNGRLIIKVRNKKWLEQLNAAVYLIERSFPSVSFSWEI